MADAPALLARGPWNPANVQVTWRNDPYVPDARVSNEADRILEELRDRGSPSHDGLAARLVNYETVDGVLKLEMQPVRWALRLLPHGAARSVSALCVVRDAAGSWLAGRRADWVASWAGRWALGAGGAVEVDENPAETLGRELEEEWSVNPERLSVEALIELPTGMVMFVGQAWLPPGAAVVPDHEHDAFAWWPSDIERWPAEAGEELRDMGGMLSSEDEWGW